MKLDLVFFCPTCVFNKVILKKYFLKSITSKSKVSLNCNIFQIKKTKFDSIFLLITKKKTNFSCYYFLISFICNMKNRRRWNMQSANNFFISSIFLSCFFETTIFVWHKLFWSVCSCLPVQCGLYNRKKIFNFKLLLFFCFLCFYF